MVMDWRIRCQCQEDPLQRTKWPSGGNTLRIAPSEQIGVASRECGSPTQALIVQNSSSAPMQLR